MINFRADLIVISVRSASTRLSLFYDTAVRWQRALGSFAVERVQETNLPRPAAMP